VVVVAVIVSLAFSAAAIAAAGDLDPTFSGDGKQTTNFGAAPTGAVGAVRQADGKIVAVGAADGNFLVARYNLDGSLDPSFSGDGRLQTNFTGFDGATDVAVQGTKIVVVGFSTASDQTAQFALARYNPDGSLDPNLSGDGKQTTVFGTDAAAGATGVALHSGKIVAVGTSNEGGAPRSLALARYNLNGSLDPSFSGDGKQTTGSAFGENAGARAVAIQADGRIVAVGERLSPNDFALARFNPDGSLDASFSDDGLQTTNFGGGGADGARGVAIQADGKIVAVGFARGFVDPPRDFGLARYNPDGSLDTSFSDDGLQTTDFLFDAGDEANDVAIQADGKIIAVGVARGGATGNDFGLARYNADGTLDTSFSGDGRRRTNFGGTSGGLPSDTANDVALQGDGRIVAVGAGNGDFALARYLGD
jgi:uncharacterized delta-60 repeat protein